MQCGRYEGLCEHFLKGVEVYALLDGGLIRTTHDSNNTPAQLKGGQIAGTGIGIRKTMGNLFWDVAVTRSIARSGLKDEGVITFFRAGVRF
ncbi:hypothetical protein JGUZn3_01340 [Entomobacter blattae]|uniref:Haemolysin activator HlyB C-terminal domain-containing protein n=2 Tax=Entomobacter blattae TaxID=2762277 RepID=A0A7H1NNP0_9PROT|nr:hypothetical protein JGUZn3_01340 [Entomobacter blattae]